MDENIQPKNSLKNSHLDFFSYDDIPNLWRIYNIVLKHTLRVMDLRAIIIQMLVCFK